MSSIIPPTSTSTSISSGSSSLSTSSSRPQSSSLFPDPASITSLLQSLDVILHDLIPIIIEYTCAIPHHPTHVIDPQDRDMIDQAPVHTIFTYREPHDGPQMKRYCFYFSGSHESHVTLPASWFQFHTSSFSLCIALRTRSSQHNSGVFSNRNDGSHGNFVCLRFGRGRIHFELDEDHDGLNYGALSTPPIDDGRWYHIVATRDGVDMTLYVNGVNVGQTKTASVTDIVGHAPVILGSEPPPNHSTYNMPFQGDVACAIIYSRALSREEIQKWMPQ